MKNKAAIVAACILGIIFLAYGIYMLLEHKYYAITNAVFVESDSITNIGFNRVGGRIIKMTKEEGDMVTKGEILAEIDPKDIITKREQLTREIDTLKNQKEQLELAAIRTNLQTIANIYSQEYTTKNIEERIKALQKRLDALNVAIEQLKRDYERNKFLFENNAIPKRQIELIETELKSKLAEKEALLKEIEATKALLSASKYQVEVAKSQRIAVEEIKKQINSVKSKIQALEKELEDINNMIEYTVLKSPFTGKIGKKFVNVGAVVAPGQPVYAIVEPTKIYILVLLEEEKMRGVRPGAKAKIKIDAYPNEKYEGVVEEILPTSAAKFALVPRDVSAGEFTKVSQRIPVRIKITKGDTSKLVVGMGGEVKIKRIR